MSMQPYTGNEQIIIEKRLPNGMLDFSAPQPPSGQMSFDELYDLYFQKTSQLVYEEPPASASWEDLSAWLSSKGWSIRKVTW